MNLESQSNGFFDNTEDNKRNHVSLVSSTVISGNSHTRTKSKEQYYNFNEDNILETKFSSEYDKPDSVRIIIQKSEILTCYDIYMMCKVPQYRICQKFSGIGNIIIPGLGLEMVCFYGCAKKDCVAVLFAGIIQQFTFCCIAGWFSACTVGCRMVMQHK